MVNLPENYNSNANFTADALLYNSIKASKHPGTFRPVRLTGMTSTSTIKGAVTEGHATVISSQNEDDYEVTYHALVANEFKQIAGGYKDLNDMGTFWLRKRPFTI